MHETLANHRLRAPPKWKWLRVVTQAVPWVFAFLIAQSTACLHTICPIPPSPPNTHRRCAILQNHSHTRRWVDRLVWAGQHPVDIPLPAPGVWIRSTRRPVAGGAVQIVRGQNFTHQRRVCFGRREQRRGVVAQVGVWDGHCRHVLIHSHLSTFHHCSVWRVSAEVFSTRVPCVSSTLASSGPGPSHRRRRSIIRLVAMGRGARAGGGGRAGRGRARAPAVGARGIVLEVRRSDTSIREGRIPALRLPALV